MLSGDALILPPFADSQPPFADLGSNVRKPADTLEAWIRIAGKNGGSAGNRSRKDGEPAGKNACRGSHHPGSHGIFFGAIVIAAGCLLLLDNLGIVRFHDFWQYWPVLLVAYGVSRVVDSRCLSGYVWGGMIALIGAFLLLDTLDIIVFNFNVVWPLLLIAFGLSAVFRGVERKSIPIGSPSSTSPARLLQ